MRAFTTSRAFPPSAPTPTARTKASSSVSDAAAQFLHGAFAHQLAFVDDGDAVAQPLHHFEHVRGEEDGGAVAHLFEQDILHQARAHGVDAFERLIHQEQLGPVDQRRGHGDALAHAFGIFGDQLLRGAVEFEQLQQLAARARAPRARSRP